MARANGEGTIGYVASEKRWRARITVRTPEGPKRKSFSGKTRKEAYNKMVKALADGPGEARRRRGIDPEKTPLEDYLEDWLEHTARANASPRTFRRYKQVVRLHLSPLIGDVKLSQVNAADVRAVKQTLLDSGKAPKTVSYVQGVLSTALNQAVSDDLVPKNPCRKVKRAKSRGTPMRALSAEEAARLVSSVRGTRHEALYLVACKLGLRQGELAGLFWDDVDLKAGALAVERSVDTTWGVLWGATKTDERREIRLPKTVAEGLRRHRSIQNAERLARLERGRGWEDPRLVFPNTLGGVNRREGVVRYFKNHLEEAGLPKIRFHDLRHTAATLMLRGGVPVPVAAKILGHKDPAMTLRVYAHVLSDMQDEAARRMDEYGF
jgi:integrase